MTFQLCGVAFTPSLVMYARGLEVSGKTFEFGHLRTSKGFR